MVTDDRNDPDGLPSGSVVPGADIWDDDLLDDAGLLDDEWTGQISTVAGADAGDDRDAGADDDDEAWMVDAHQMIAHTDDDGPHDGSRGVEADDDASTEAFGSKLQRWGATSMMGASLSGIGLGIEKAIFGKESTQIEIEADDDDDGHRDPIRVKLDPDDPANSVAVLRPWMADRRSGGDQTG